MLYSISGHGASTRSADSRDTQIWGVQGSPREMRALVVFPSARHPHYHLETPIFGDLFYVLQLLTFDSRTQ